MIRILQIHIYIYTHPHSMHAWKFVCTYLRLCAWPVRKYIYVYMYVCMNVCMYVCVHCSLHVCNPFPLILNAPQPLPKIQKLDFGAGVFILGGVSGHPGMSQIESNNEPDTKTAHRAAVPAVKQTVSP